jgi:uncharacterized membrane protein YuzA (DUF378 family)
MENMNYCKHFWLIKFRMLLVALVIIGALNWGATGYGYNFVDIISNKVDSLSGYSCHIDKVIYILVAVSGLLLALRRDTWLPFLGCAALPTGVVPLRTPDNSNIKVNVKVRPNSKVIYWAALGKDNHDQYVENAYNNYSNSGVVMSDSNGNAELIIAEGGSYHIHPFGRTIPRHIHYRVFGKHGGMIGPVKTIYY